MFQHVLFGSICLAEHTGARTRRGETLDFRSTSTCSLTFRILNKLTLTTTSETCFLFSFLERCATLGDLVAVSAITGLHMLLYLSYLASKTIFRRNE